MNAGQISLTSYSYSQTDSKDLRLEFKLKSKIKSELRLNHLFASLTKKCLITQGCEKKSEIFTSINSSDNKDNDNIISEDNGMSDGTVV